MIVDGFAAWVVCAVAVLINGGGFLWWCYGIVNLRRREEGALESWQEAERVLEDLKTVSLALRAQFEKQVLAIRASYEAALLEFVQNMDGEVPTLKPQLPKAH